MCKSKYTGEEAKRFLALFENDKTLQQIAEYRYVDGMKYEEIGTLVGYSERQIGRLCKKIEQIANREPAAWKVSMMNTFLGGRG